MRQRTLKRFEEWKEDVNVVAMLMSRVAEGESLRDICKAQEVAYSLVARWIAETPLLKQQYDVALQLHADSIAHEALTIADEQCEVEKKDGSTYDPDVARDKLRVDTRLKLAGKWDRQRYGEREPAAVNVTVNLGDIRREIEVLEQKLGLAPAALPALAEALTIEQQQPQQTDDRGLI